MATFRRLWAFSPQFNLVHLYSEDDHHPADVPTHQSIAGDLREVGITHGHAYEIPGGWRVLDFEHKPVGDPYVARQVVEALRKQTQPGPWRPHDDPDFGLADRFHYGRRLMPREASKLHDFLMNPKSRPDLQTPEGQRWLTYLQHHHTEALDPLMPWLTREWKKGRLHHSEDGTIGHIYEQVPHPPERGWQKRVIDGRDLHHWADFMNSTHPLRRGLGDIMQYQLPQFRERIQQWDAEMAAKAHDEALKGGEFVHQTPDGYTIRQLHLPEELEAEGEAMGHCVGGFGYAGQVARGDTMIYSLRDPQGKPHATIELAPKRYHAVEHPPFDVDTAMDNHAVLGHAPAELKDAIRQYDATGVTDYHPADVAELHRVLTQRHEAERPTRGRPMPHNGDIVQIQGKGNQEPNSEYKRQLRHWFESFSPDERPTRYDDEDEYLTYPEEIQERHLTGPANTDDYGLPGPPVRADYERLMTHIRTYDRGPWSTHDRDDVANIYQLAKTHGQIPELASAAETHGEEQQQSFDEWTELNREHLQHPYDPDAWDELPPEQAAQAEKAYYDEEDELRTEHPGVMASDQMFSLLRPHYWDEGTHPTNPQSGYYNETQPPQPVTTTPAIASHR